MNNEDYINKYLISIIGIFALIFGIAIKDIFYLFVGVMLILYSFRKKIKPYLKPGKELRKNIKAIMEYSPLIGFGIGAILVWCVTINGPITVALVIFAFLWVVSD